MSTSPERMADAPAVNAATAADTEAQRPVEAAAAWLRGRKRLLLLTHERPDGDALGSLLGGCRILAASGVAVRGYLRGPLPRRFQFLAEPPLPLFTGVEPPPADCDGIICLDATGWARVDKPEGLPAGVSVLNLDHHPDNAAFGAVNCVLPQLAATAQILARVAWAADLAISAAAADCLLTGLIMDTGGFHFANTSPAALRDAARLMECGSDYCRLMDALFFREPFNRRVLAARLVANAVFALGGRLAYCVVRPEWFTELQLSPADTEGLIDSLRVIDGVDVACLLQPEPGQVRLSLRARQRDLPVDRLAHEFGGGGHAMAAGARMTGVTPEEAAARLVNAVQRMISG